MSFCNTLINWIQLNLWGGGVFMCIYTLYFKYLIYSAAKTFLYLSTFEFYATDTEYLAQKTRQHGTRPPSQGFEPTSFCLKDELAPCASLQPLDVSGVSGTKTGAFPYLILWHDKERVPVQWEGHVPQDGAAILHHGHRLVQNSPLHRTVHSDLQGHRWIKKGESEGLAAGLWLNSCGALEEWHLLSIEYQFVCCVRSALHLVASSPCPSKTTMLWENIH